jgi:pilus assembly protein FimV
VAEAEVYIAYGRDAQAEEILKEAMTRDKSRHEIALKLLEIYHARKSTQAFETVARELKEAIGTDHPIWSKAAAMGSSIDPGNSLYGGAGPAYATTGAYATGADSLLAADERAVAPPDLDFDLGFTDSASSPTDASRPIDITSSNSPQVAGGSMDFDLDLNATSPGFTAPAPAAGLDFDLAADAPLAAGGEAVPASAPESTGFDFDLSALSLDAPPLAETPPPVAPVAGNTPLAMNLSEFSLDLDVPADSSVAGGSAVATKLELAKAYIEIGDSDGAKEILNEVAREGSALQQEEAKSILAGL